MSETTDVRRMGNGSSKRSADDSDNNSSASGRSSKRTRSGCFTCRLRRKKCDEGRPACQTCVNLHVKCDYDQPVWWSSQELRGIQKEIIKDNVKANKMTVKNNNMIMGHLVPTKKPNTSSFPTFPASDFNFSYPFYAESGNPYAPESTIPTFASLSYAQQFPQAQVYKPRSQQVQRPVQLQHPQLQLGQLQRQPQQPQQTTEKKQKKKDHRKEPAQLQQQQSQQPQESEPEPEQELEQQQLPQGLQHQELPQQQLPQHQLPQELPQQQLTQQQYEIDVTTEHQVFINDVQTQSDTTVATFSAMGVPDFTGFPDISSLPDFSDPSNFPALPEFPALPSFLAAPFPEGWVEQPSTLIEEIDPILTLPQPDEEPVVEEQDRPLLKHFIDNVLRLFFPIVEAFQGGENERTRAILNSLEHNKSYLHCCLSVAAIHLKNTVKIQGSVIKQDILRHRFESVSNLSASLRANTNLEKVLDSTLAMIFFHCAVGGPEDDVPDIAWTDHFQASVTLLKRLDIFPVNMRTKPACPTFSVSLTTWIDILGATLLGKTPVFAHTYRDKHLSAIPSGLFELMGVEDRLMYLIGEIACLEALILNGRLRHELICGHIEALGQQLDSTEPYDRTIERPFLGRNGPFVPAKLAKTINAVFRLAARIYLASIAPGFDCHDPAVMSLVEAATRAIEFIPDGPNGYDRSIVWPLLIVGTFSVPMSSFRCVMHRRVIELGELSSFGSFGRLYRLLQEIWRLSDGPFFIPTGANAGTITSPHTGTRQMKPIRPQHTHWRTVMEKKGWKYLLI